MEDSDEEYKGEKERSRSEEDLMEEEEEDLEQKNITKQHKKKRIYSIKIIATVVNKTLK